MSNGGRSSILLAIIIIVGFICGTCTRITKMCLDASKPQTTQIDRSKQ